MNGLNGMNRFQVVVYIVSISKLDVGFDSTFN